MMGEREEGKKERDVKKVTENKRNKNKTQSAIERVLKWPQKVINYNNTVHPHTCSLIKC